MRVAASVLALFSVIAMAGCATVMKTMTNPSMVAGSDVVELIDVDAGLIAQRHPAVPIGRAQCPVLLNLSGGRIETCTVAVGGKPMRIGVRRIGTLAVGLTDVEAPVLRREIERQIAQDYHTGSVRCGEPALEIAAVPVHLKCSAGTYGRPVSVLITSRTGQAYTGRSPPLRGWPSQRRMLGDAIARQDRVVIEGPALERYLRALANGLSHDELLRRKLLGPAHCPARVALAPGQYARCDVWLGDSRLRFDLRFDKGRGFVPEAEGTIVVVDVIRAAVQRAYAHARFVEGKPGAGTVRCTGAPLFVTQPGDEFPCYAQADRERRVIVVRIDDANAGFSIVGVRPVSTAVL